MIISSYVLCIDKNCLKLTPFLFLTSCSDSVFYAVPDKLRRPLIFYFCHPAALYINKLHLVGLVGKFSMHGRNF